MGELSGLAQLARNFKDLIHLNLKFEYFPGVSNKFLFLNRSGAQLNCNFLNRVKLNGQLVEIASGRLNGSLQAVLVQLLTNDHFNRHFIYSSKRLLLKRAIIRFLLLFALACHSAEILVSC